MNSKLILPKLLSEGMVLQRRKRIHIWGWDKPGAQIEVKLDNLMSGGTADENGRFDIYLPAREWRDKFNSYFYRKSGIADEKGRTIY